MKWLRERGIVFWFWVAWIGSFLIGGLIIFGMIATQQDKISFNFLKAKPNLALTITDAPDPVEPGRDLTYTISIVNNGGGEAKKIVMESTLPEGVTFVSATPDSPSCYEVDKLVNCRLGAMSKDVQKEVVIVVKVDPTTMGTIINTATVTTSATDSNTDDNTTTESTTVK